MFQKSIFVVFLWVFLLSGCATLKPTDQQTADLVFIESLGAVFDNNPSYKPVVLDLVNEAKAALDAHTLVTEGGASAWLMNHLQEKFKNDTSVNPRLKRTLLLLGRLYMPGWESQMFSGITPAQKDQLYHLISLIQASTE